MYSAYLKKDFIHDLKAGFITSVVALPLAIAFAIASGVHPIMGLYTAVIAGLLGSAFGGSKFSITGPTGAMTVLILSTVNKFGIEGLLAAGLLAGIFQVIFGLIKLGKLVKYIPLPIVSGFTAGIGVIILAGQIPSLFGLSIPPKELVWETLGEVAAHTGSYSGTAFLIGAGTVLALFLLPRLTSGIRHLKNVPPSIIMLILTTSAAFYFSLGIPQVGQVPTGFPEFKLINISFDLIRSVLPAAFTIALLGSIEALLCAVVCDGMTNTHHRSNRELLAQGLANTALPFFGGMPATAAIARSAINIREGARTRVSGIIHALILLAIILFFGPLVQYIPKAFLAGILVFVSIRMINVQEFRTITHISKAESMVLLATFFLTVFTDLVFAIQVGMVLAIFLLFIRFSSLLDVRAMEEYDKDKRINSLVSSKPHLMEMVNIYTLHGPFFFGAMNVFEQKMQEHLDVSKRVTILRMRHVPFIDSTGVESLKRFIRDRHRHHGHVFLVGLQDSVKEALYKDSEFAELMKGEKVFRNTKQAISHTEKNIAIYAKK